MMALCDAIDVEPVFTTNAVGPETPQDMADLVEYLVLAQPMSCM